MEKMRILTSEAQVDVEAWAGTASAIVVEVPQMCVVAFRPELQPFRT